MKKRFLKTVIAALSVLVLASGCGGKSTEKEGPAESKEVTSEKSDSKKDSKKEKKKDKDSDKKKKDKEEKDENKSAAYTSAEHVENNYVYVNTTEELINAIESNTTIVLSPGTYNLTEWAYTTDEFNRIRGDEEVFVNTHVSLYDAYDGPQVKISNISNMKIVNYGDWDEVEIICEPRYAYVLEFENCENVEMQGITMGHTPEQGSCTGAVIGASYCEDLSFEYMDLYGCGTYGLEAYYSDQISFISCDIHDCSYGCLSLVYVNDVLCENVGFYDCMDAFCAFSLYGSVLNLMQCSYNNLPDEMISTNETSFVRILDGYFDDRAADSVNNAIASGEYVIYQVTPEDEYDE